MDHGHSCAKKGGRKWLGLGRCEGPADLLRRGEKMQRNSQGPPRLIGACPLHNPGSFVHICVLHIMCYGQKFDRLYICHYLAIVGYCSYDLIEEDVDIQ